MHIALLFGGVSNEHAISCRSAENVYSAITEAGHRPVPIYCREHLSKPRKARRSFFPLVVGSTPTQAERSLSMLFSLASMDNMARMVPSKAC